MQLLVLDLGLGVVTHYIRSILRELKMNKKNRRPRINGLVYQVKAEDCDKLEKALEKFPKPFRGEFKLQSESEEVMESNWIKVELKKPPAAISVLIAHKNSLDKYWVSIAQYVPPKTVLAEDFLSNDIDTLSCEEYDEKNDCYWVIEGWWEASVSAEINWHISDEVTHWMPLPKTPTINFT